MYLILTQMHAVVCSYRGLVKLGNSMKLRRSLVLLVSLLTAALPQVANAFPSPDLTCRLPGNDSETFLSIDDMAPQVKQELTRRMGDPSGRHLNMAARDQEFQMGDVIVDPTLPPRRFIQGGRIGTRWYVWYEHGGETYASNVAIFELPNGAMPQLVFFDTTSQLCAATKAHLNDAPSDAITFDKEHW